MENTVCFDHICSCLPGYQVSSNGTSCTELNDTEHSTLCLDCSHSGNISLNSSSANYFSQFLTPGRENVTDLSESVVSHASQGIVTVAIGADSITDTEATTVSQNTRGQYNTSITWELQMATEKGVPQIDNGTENETETDIDGKHLNQVSLNTTESITPVEKPQKRLQTDNINFQAGEMTTHSTFVQNVNISTNHDSSDDSIEDLNCPLGQCKPTTLGDNCSLSEQCLAVDINSVCNKEYVCVCKQGYKAVENKNTTVCSIIHLGDRCGSDAECIFATSNSECSNGTCSCKGGFMAIISNGTQTCNARLIGKRCSTQEECSNSVSNSICNMTSGVCECTFGYKTLDFRSCTGLVIGDPCMIDAHCTLNIPNSWCRNYMCICDSGHVTDDETGKCRNIEIGDSCVSGVQCSFSIKHSTCYNETCRCNKGFVPSRNKLACSERQITDMCTDDADCLETFHETVCVNKACICRVKGYYFDNLQQACKPFKLMSNFCPTDLECKKYIENSHCSNDVCKCMTGFKTSNDSSKCIERTLLDPCEQSNDCSYAVEDSICFDGICDCKPGYYRLNGSCQMRKIHDPCNNDSDCSDVMNRTTCHEGECRCQTGYYNKANRTCIESKLYVSFATEFSYCIHDLLQIFSKF